MVLCFPLGLCVFVIKEVLIYDISKLSHSPHKHLTLSMLATQNVYSKSTIHILNFHKNTHTNQLHNILTLISLKQTHQTKDHKTHIPQKPLTHKSQQFSMFRHITKQKHNKRRYKHNNPLKHNKHHQKKRYYSQHHQNETTFNQHKWKFLSLGITSSIGVALYLFCMRFLLFNCRG